MSRRIAAAAIAALALAGCTTIEPWETTDHRPIYLDAGDGAAQVKPGRYILAAPLREGQSCYLFVNGWALKYTHQTPRVPVTISPGDRLIRSDAGSVAPGAKVPRCVWRLVEGAA